MGGRMSVTGTPASLIRRASLALSTPYVAPSDETEALATTTFAEVFNLDQVGLNDEFVELGGDSLLAEVLSLALTERAGIEFQPSSLDELGSPREIARLIESREVAPGWLDIAKYAQSPKADMSVLKAWRTVLRHLPATAASNFIDDSYQDLQVVPADGGAEADSAPAPIVFVFCDSGQRFAIPLNMIHRWLGRIGAHIVYLRDFRKLFYVTGVSSLGRNYATSIVALRRLIDKLGARSVHCMGDSAGVYGALQMGLDLGAKSVLCLSGPTELTAPKMPKIMRQFAKKLPNAKALDPAMLTVRGRYESSPIYPRIRHIYGGAHDRDREEAERLAGMEGVELVRLAGWPHHMVIDALMETGEFDAHLNWLLEADAVTNPDPAAQPSWSLGSDGTEPPPASQGPFSRLLGYLAPQWR